MRNSKVKKLNKRQLVGIRSCRAETVKILVILLCMALWVKIGLNQNWHLSEVLPEVISIFVLFVMGLLINIKNDFPIFQMRKFEFSKNFLYSIILAFSLLFIFIIYKNIVDPNFINYIAGLSLHDICSVIVFLLPIFLFVIYLIYLNFKFFDKSNTKKKARVYNEVVEASIVGYKSLMIKVILLIMAISLWYKAGFLGVFNFQDVYVEIICLLAIFCLFIVGNLENRLSLFYNNRVQIGSSLVASVLLPYFLVLVYALLNRDFRVVLFSMSLKEYISLFIYMSPLFLGASLLFYKGCGKESKKQVSKKKNKIVQNAIISFVITLVGALLLFLYIYFSILDIFTFETFLQIIMLFIPLCVIIYLVLYSGIRYINK